MNLKKSLLFLSAVLMSSAAFAGNAFDMQSLFVKPAPEFTAAERPAATIYAYTRFFEGFSNRIAAANATEADEQIIQAVETYMLPELRAFAEASSVTEENRPTGESLQEADLRVRQAGQKVIPLLIQQFDFKEITQVLANNGGKNGFPKAFSANQLDTEILDLTALDLSVAYLAGTGALTAEETILLELLINGKIKKLK